MVLSVALFLALGSLIGVGAVMRSPAEDPGSQTAAIGGPFRLTDQHGQRVAAKDFKGEWMLVYFGYTFCPDVCPMTLANMTLALEELPEHLAERITPVFITVDPQRDTVEQLKEYAPLFHDRLVALTGTDAEIKAAARAYKVYFGKAADSGDGEDDYLMDHSGFVYLMDPDGKYRAHFSHNTGVDELARRLEQEVAGGVS
ncbi:MAG: SCO family protein [Geminicoccaceae bacterium]|nr:SCO family protein [Geminicoccaceae bacterium]